MAINRYNKTNLDQQYKKGGGGLPADVGPYIGVVMDNNDPTRCGRVRVWLKTYGDADKNDEANWRTVSYLSPFFGTTPHDLHDKSPNKTYQNAHSYGMWMTSPDLGVEVLCIFVNGDPNLGYYIGYVPEPQANHMVPGIGARENGAVADPENDASAYAKASQLPVVEISKSDKEMQNPAFYNSTKPVHKVIAAQLWAQGTITDNIRGPITSSAQRESPSQTYGISTPGTPIFQGNIDKTNLKDKAETGTITTAEAKVLAREGGHTFVMDDGDFEGKNKLIRLRSSKGHQITMSDDGDTIYIQHANGLTWIELGEQGTVDIFSENSINLRTKGEINMHADNNINFYSAKSINMFAKDNIKLECNKNFDIIGKLKTSIYSEKKVLIKSDGVLSTESVQKTTIKAGGDIVEQGAKILMNSGAASTVPKPQYITHTSLPDTEMQSATGWESIDGKLDSIVSRAPTHEPYAEHNKGVNIKSVVGAPSTPLAQPSPAKTQEVINQASNQPPVPNPVETADVAKQANGE